MGRPPPRGARLHAFPLPMLVFWGLAGLSGAGTILPKNADRRYGYGLELPNIQK